VNRLLTGPTAKFLTSLLAIFRLSHWKQWLWKGGKESKQKIAKEANKTKARNSLIAKEEVKYTVQKRGGSKKAEPGL
jgi:hypothetical protein